MVVKVLIVDDSNFFRLRLRKIIDSHPQLSVIGEAANGLEGVEQAKTLRPDIITMDYEMPVMDGITAIKQIMQHCPTAILVFSSLSHEGARVTLNAMDAGAKDFLPKSFESMGSDASRIHSIICDKLLSMVPIKPRTGTGYQWSSQAQHTLSKRPKLLILGTSTGGPIALQKILSRLPMDFPLPILVIQHMPAAFTHPFAQRLDRLCRMTIAEAQANSVIEPGEVLIAPGGQQLMLTAQGRIKVFPGDERLFYKPSIDIAFASAAKQYGDGVLAVVLTGMGNDGTEGARLLKQSGSQVWVQDKVSCTIDGMPNSVIEAGLADAVVKLDELSQKLLEVGQLPLR